MSELSAEDRERLEGWAENMAAAGATTDAETVTRALALIDQQEKALEAADELARVVEESPVGYGLPRSARAYRSARATSTKEDG
jgi:ubiquinone/menaquinone biosynthesis C-methylase UbiE